MKKHMIILLTLVMFIILTACGDDGDTIVVGSKDTTEQDLLVTMTAEILEDNGFSVEQKSGLGSATLRQAMVSGEVDVSWDYTGSILIDGLGEDPVYDEEKAYQKVQEIDKKKNDIIWTNKSDVNNSYNLMLREEDADELGIHTLSDLADYENEHPNELDVAANAEFAEREDGLVGIEKTYGFEFDPENIIKMEIGLTFEAINENEVELAQGTTTDARIKAYDLVVLEDDKDFFPYFNIIFGILGDIDEKHPDIKEIVEPIKELDNDEMLDLTYKIQMEGENVSTVAKDWLKENELIEK